MYLQKIEDENVYYFSNDRSGLGKDLIEGELTEVLNFVNTSLINNDTDFQANEPFESFPNGGIVTSVSKWYALALKPNFWQVIKTEDNITTHLPYVPTVKGSLTDIISHVYNDIMTG